MSWSYDNGDELVVVVVVVVVLVVVAVVLVGEVGEELPELAQAAVRAMSTAQVVRVNGEEWRTHHGRGTAEFVPA
jgi:hypothetical protein